MKKKGKLIVIDGTDGSGKETQTTLLAKKLRELGYEVLIVDFPQYGKISAAVVTAYLNGEFGHKASDVKAEIASIFFAIDRWSAKPAIEEALKAGKIVLCNRYVSANKGHQASKISDPVKLDKFLDWVDDLEHNIFELPRPDQIFLLYLPSEIGQQLVSKKAKSTREYIKNKDKDIHEKDKEHLKKAEKTYLYVAKKEQWQIINCLDLKKNLRTIEDINHDLLSETIRLLK